MTTTRSVITRAVMLPLAVVLAVVSVGAQGRPATGDPIRLVRAALAHGDLTGARAIADRAAGDAAANAVALALVDMFQGRDAEARTRLLPIADRQPLGEAAVELGLLDLRTGRG